MMPEVINISLLRGKCSQYLQINPMMLTKAERDRFIQELNMLGAGEHRLTHHLYDLVYFSYKLDLYEEFAKLISQKTPLRGLRILDVGAGRHIRSSVALKKKGARVDAMDREARKREGVQVINEWFDKETNISKYDLVVGLQLPKECIESIVQAAESERKKYILIPSGDAFQDDWEMLRFLANNRGAKKERWEVEGIIHFNVVTNL